MRYVFHAVKNEGVRLVDTWWRNRYDISSGDVIPLNITWNNATSCSWSISIVAIIEVKGSIANVVVVYIGRINSSWIPKSAMAISFPLSKPRLSASISWDISVGKYAFKWDRVRPLSCVLGISLQDMATIIGMDIGNLSKVEHHKLDVNILILFSYHIILKIPIERLFKNHYIFRDVNC